MVSIYNLENRDQIPQLLADRGYSGVGVEIGGHLGEYSAKLLSHSKLSRLYSVDTWSAEFPGLPAGMNPFHSFSECADRLWKHGHRAVMLRLPSVEAADLFKDNSLDFVYIDGNHTLESVTSDIAAWWPKVRRGGVCAGHDYNVISSEVREAVDRHCATHRLVLHLTECDFLHGPERHVIRSWLVEKPGG
jgi:hypothetical protein